MAIGISLGRCSGPFILSHAQTRRTPFGAPVSSGDLTPHRACDDRACDARAYIPRAPTREQQEHEAANHLERREQARQARMRNDVAIADRADDGEKDRLREAQRARDAAHIEMRVGGVLREDVVGRGEQDDEQRIEGEKGKGRDHQLRDAEDGEGLEKPAFATATRKTKRGRTATLATSGTSRRVSGVGGPSDWSLGSQYRKGARRIGALWT